MRFVVIISLIVVLFVAAFLIIPYSGQIMESITPKPSPKITAWVDQNPPPAYDPDACTLRVQWTIANDGDTAHDVYVALIVADSATGQVINKKTEVIGTIEKGQQNSRLTNITGICPEPGKNVLYNVAVNVLNYSV